MDWAGAQWLMIFYIGMRVIVQYAVMIGLLPNKLTGPELSNRQKFIYNRINDAIFIVVLWWGGFF